MFPNPWPFPCRAVMTRLFSMRDTINVHWRVLALFGVFIDYSISRPEATQQQQQHTTQDNNTKICCERNLKLMHNEDAETSSLQTPDTYWTNQIFSFTLKFKTFFSSFCCFSFHSLFCCFDSGFVCLCLHSFCADFLGERSVTQMQSDSESESESWRASSSSSLSSSSNFQSLCLY